MPPRTHHICMFPGCERPHCARGLCNGHWQQQRRGEELRNLRRVRPPAATEAERKARKRDSHRARTYGMDAAAWEALFVSQGRSCAVCGSQDPRHKRGWATDHDHRTALVRGILCQPCNSAIGALGDTLCGVRAAFDYLVRAEAC